MSIEIMIQGDRATVDRLNEIIASVSSDPYWQRELMPLMESGRRFAASISPVATGAYQHSHEVLTVDMGVMMRIDPTATNPKTGQPVTRYAGFVEQRETVYARTSDHVRHLIQDMEVL